MSILTGVVTQQIAVREGLTDTTKYLLLGWMLGSTPVGLGITLALVNRDADNLPPHGNVGIGKGGLVVPKLAKAPM